MSLQKTIRRKFELEGRCFYSGNRVKAIFNPAQEDTGIVFNTILGDVRHTLRNAVPCRRSILLQSVEASIINVEHVTSTLKYGYGIDNVYIIVRRMPPNKLSRCIPYYTCSTSTEVFPETGDQEITLCKKLDEVGIEEQDKENIRLSLKKPFVTEKLSFFPIEEGLVMEATTDYPYIGEQVFRTEITTENYKEQLAGARRYAEHVKYLNFLPTAVRDRMASFLAMFFNPGYGIGHGFSRENVFLPVKNQAEWFSQENYCSEVARHTIVDRLGAIALLNGRLENVRCMMKFSNHINDLKVLNEMKNEMSWSFGSGRKVY
jgi:UDP-3-O-acyl-N-acetylglucosamine deacetylase